MWNRCTYVPLLLIRTFVRIMKDIPRRKPIKLNFLILCARLMLAFVFCKNIKISREHFCGVEELNPRFSTRNHIMGHRICWCYNGTLWSSLDLPWLRSWEYYYTKRIAMYLPSHHKCAALRQSQKLCFSSRRIHSHPFGCGQSHVWVSVFQS